MPYFAIKVYSALHRVVPPLCAVFFYTCALTNAAEPKLLPRPTFYIAPAIEGLYFCDEGASKVALTSVEDVTNYCLNRKLDGAKAITRLLDTLEPGGAVGQVQIGYQATLQLLSLYKKVGATWQIDSTKLDAFARLLTQVKRPVVVYLAADHFDSQGPITDELLKDPDNLLALSDGEAPISGYFGYRIAPYTLRTHESIPVNRYRYTALRHVAAKLIAMPQEVQNRIVAITLAGELHQLFPDFESGTGRFESMRVTDYSPGSISEFQNWLGRKFGTIQKFNLKHALNYKNFSEVLPPSKDIRTQKLSKFEEHFDAYAAGSLPVSGWLWDADNQLEKIALYVDGEFHSIIPYGLNRLDVYRAVDSVTSPNVGYRIDLDYTRMTYGKHSIDVIGQFSAGQYSLGRAEFKVMRKDRLDSKESNKAKPLSFPPVSKLKSVKTWLDLPNPMQDVHFNPLAMEWNEFRRWQVKQFLKNFYEIAIRAGLPKEKLYSHQILPEINSSWNEQLFASRDTLTEMSPWKLGVNLYGGATNSSWVQAFLQTRKAGAYGVPEFNPQQWKSPTAHRDAIAKQYDAGARFISPYYFSLVPTRFKDKAPNAVAATEIRSDNTKEGSDLFFRAIVDFARY